MGRNCCAKALIKEVLGNSLRSFDERLEAQKLIYIAQKIFGVDFGYSFMWYSRGPYSRELAKDLRACEPSSINKCVPASVLNLIRLFMNDLRELSTPLPKSLEIIASYLMLENEVFPKPENPLKELMRRKPYLGEKEIAEVMKVVKNYCP